MHNRKVDKTAHHTYIFGRVAINQKYSGANDGCDGENHHAHHHRVARVGVKVYNGIGDEGHTGENEVPTTQELIGAKVLAEEAQLASEHGPHWRVVNCA
jgi:hypothetical protein